jgi:hypothetical protein
MNEFADIRSRNKKLVWIVVLALLAALVLAEPAWADHEGESDWNITFHEVSPASSFASTENGGGGYSGDDAYDPAAGGQPRVSLVKPFQASTGSYSGDDVYDPAAGGMSFIDDPAFSASRSNQGVVAAEASERNFVRFIDDPALSATAEAIGDEAARFLDDPAFSGAEATAAEFALFAANPELSAARNFAGAFALGGNAAFLASNPELSAARNYAGAEIRAAGADGFATFSANPELKSLEEFCGC